MGPQNAPRWCQDGSLVVLGASFRFLNFRLDFASSWPPFGTVVGCQNGAHRVVVNWGYPPHLGSQGGALIVLVRFLVRLAVWGSFLKPLGHLLGPYLGHCWCHFRPSWGPFSLRGCCFLCMFLWGFVAACWSPCTVFDWSPFDFPFVNVALGPGPCGLRAARLNKLL